MTLLPGVSVLCLPAPGQSHPQHNYDMYLRKLGEANHASSATSRSRVKRSGSHCPRPCTVVCGSNDRVYCNFCHATCL